MKLYVTLTSPYARLVRIVLLEKGLEDRIDIVEATTRQQGSPYYAINPSGRVPCLVREDAPTLEGSGLICRYLDHLDGAPMFDPPSGDAFWEAMRLQEQALALMDGLAVWGREYYRPEDERSPGVIAHEQARVARLMRVWEQDVTHPHLNGALNMVQIMLITALELDARNPNFVWRADYPALLAWLSGHAGRPSVIATRPETPIVVA